MTDDPTQTTGKPDPREPLNAAEEAKFRESVRRIGYDAASTSNWWSNHAAIRLLATLDAARDQAATETRLELLTALRTRVEALAGECHDQSGLGCDASPCVENVERAAVLRLLDSETPSPAEEPNDE